MKSRNILPPTYFWASVALMVVLHVLLPVVAIIPWPYRLLGALPAGAGLWLALWSHRLFDRSGSTIKPFEQSSELFTAGPYRFSRHPMYVGMVLVLLGLAVGLGSVTPAAVVVAFAWVLRRFAIIEERAMAETFGDAYIEYSRRVRRWV